MTSTKSPFNTTTGKHQTHRAITLQPQRVPGTRMSHSYSLNMSCSHISVIAHHSLLNQLSQAEASKIRRPMWGSNPRPWDVSVLISCVRVSCSTDWANRAAYSPITCFHHQVIIFKSRRCFITHHRQFFGLHLRIAFTQHKVISTSMQSFFKLGIVELVVFYHWCVSKIWQLWRSHLMANCECRQLHASI